MLKMRANMAAMDYAIYWVEDGGRFVVSGTYAPRFAKDDFKKKRGDEDRFEKRCEKMKLTAANVNAGFIGNATASNVSGRQALCKEFGINTICQEKVTGGVLE